MKLCYDVIKCLLRTEKTVELAKEKQYVFAVYPNTNKIEIKNAVEEIYKVKVAAVNTVSMPGKKKRVRQKMGYTTPWKKAIVKLKEGEIQGVASGS